MRRGNSLENRDKPVVRAETSQPASPIYTVTKSPSHSAAQGALLHRHPRIALLGFRKQARPRGPVPSWFWGGRPFLEGERYLII